MVKADGLLYMALFILNWFMVKVYGLFPVIIGTWLFYMVILYGFPLQHEEYEALHRSNGVPKNI